MLITLLLLTSPLWAAEIRVETYERVTIQVDGDPVPLSPQTHAAVARGLAPGEHVVAVFGSGEQALVTRNVQLDSTQELRMAWIDQSLVLTRQTGTSPERVEPGRPTPGGFAMDAPISAGNTIEVGPYPMPPSTFQQLLREVSLASFPSEKLSAVERAASIHYFSIAQMDTLLNQFPFSDDKLAVTRVLAPRAVDPDNAAVLGSHFDFGNTRSEVLTLFGHSLE